MYRPSESTVIIHGLVTKCTIINQTIIFSLDPLSAYIIINVAHYFYISDSKMHQSVYFCILNSLKISAGFAPNPTGVSAPRPCGLSPHPDDNPAIGQNSALSNPFIKSLIIRGDIHGSSLFCESHDRTPNSMYRFLYSYTG